MLELAEQSKSNGLYYWFHDKLQYTYKMGNDAFRLQHSSRNDSNETAGRIYLTEDNASDQHEHMLQFCSKSENWSATQETFAFHSLRHKESHES